MFNPYSVAKICGKYYVKFLSYNAAFQYPWSYRFIGEGRYPQSLEYLKYAKSFDTEEAAENFISDILKEN